MKYVEIKSHFEDLETIHLMTAKWIIAW